MKYNLQVLSEPVEPAGVEELQAFRFGDGSPFPASYVRFAKQYGYGVTCGEFLIYVPMGDYCDSFTVQSAAIKATYADALESPDKVWFPLEPDADFDKLRRLIPFSRSENGYYLFWDAKRREPDEMDIYITDFKGLGFIKAAANLYELLDKMTNPDRFKEVFPLFAREPLPATFWPLRKISG